MDQRRTLVAIIDKNPLLTELYRVELSDTGYEVRAENDVEKAAKLISTWKPDLVLIDPYDGNNYRWDVLTEIRECDVRLPILVCLSFKVLPEQCDVRLADGCIIKSFDVSGLVSEVQTLLAMKGPRERW